MWHLNAVWVSVFSLLWSVQRLICIHQGSRVTFRIRTEWIVSIYIILFFFKWQFNIKFQKYFDCPLSVSLEPLVLMHACTLFLKLHYYKLYSKVSCSFSFPLHYFRLSLLILCLLILMLDTILCVGHPLWRSPPPLFVITLPTWNFKSWQPIARNLRIQQTLQPMDPMEGEKEERSDSGSLPSFLTQNTQPVSCTGNPVWRSAWLLGLVRWRIIVFKCVHMRNAVSLLYHPHCFWTVMFCIYIYIYFFFPDFLFRGCHFNDMLCIHNPPWSHSNGCYLSQYIQYMCHFSPCPSFIILFLCCSYVLFFMCLFIWLF